MSERVKLFIVEPNETVLRAMQTRLQFTDAIEVVGVDTLPLSVPREEVDVVLLGLQGYDHDLAWLGSWIEYFVEGETAVILLTPYSDDHEQQELLRYGASLYLLKTINTPDLVKQILQTAVKMKKEWAISQ